ncbi:RNA polymerase sigma factor [Pedobacter glucosidilyticus]|uniref:RNA polymerase sigma factor n=1 Tax=Pedobacter glucosidilyticus TaxID=1122941 RepID=UPI0026ED24BD|nr:RNA polymerase sigma-70 factor [Pedobacter glucosidilyticus]
MSHIIKASGDDERELVKDLVNGNQNAFNQLYQKYSGLIYQKIFLMTKYEHIADELLQDIFLKVWSNRVSINPDKSFKAWLYTIAQNVVYDYYRKLAHDKKMQDYFIESFTNLYSETEDYLLNKERSAILNAALETLSPKRREIFRLCKFEDKSYKEVADLLQISPSTVSNQLVAATKSIKEYVFLHAQEFLMICISLYLKK